jgi:hypothetical protein
MEEKYKTILECFSSVIFYNGYSDFFKDLYKKFREYMEEWWAKKHNHYFSIYYNNTFEWMDEFAYWQIQVLRIMLVEMFGECWTSPRTWWIVDEDGFDKFINSLIDDIEWYLEF